MMLILSCTQDGVSYDEAQIIVLILIFRFVIGKMIYSKKRKPKSNESTRTKRVN